jgi:hypothetical protein
MPRHGDGERALLESADKIEARLARALVLAMQRLRDRLPLEALERAVSAGDVRYASMVVDTIDVEDVLEPSGEILRDAFLKGGKLGAEDVKHG